MISISSQVTQSTFVLYSCSILHDVAARRYLPPQVTPSLHSALADYFSGTFHNKVKPLKTKTQTFIADRKQPAQPLRFGEPAGPVNHRKLTELPFHLQHAGRHDELISLCLGNYDWVATVAATCGIDDVLRDVSMATVTSSSISSGLRHQLALVRETLEMVQVSHTRERPNNSLAVDIVGRLTALADRYPEVIGKVS